MGKYQGNMGSTSLGVVQMGCYFLP